jgi:hypothetical protein
MRLYGVYSQHKLRSRAHDKLQLALTLEQYSGVHHVWYTHYRPTPDVWRLRPEVARTVHIEIPNMRRLLQQRRRCHPRSNSGDRATKRRTAARKGGNQAL